MRISRNPFHFEHRFGITFAFGLSQMALPSQEGAALHEKNGKSGLGCIIDFILDVLTGALVCQLFGLQALNKCIKG